MSSFGQLHTLFRLRVNIFDLSSNVAVGQDIVYRKWVNVFSQETKQFLEGHSGDRIQWGQTFLFKFIGLYASDSTLTAF